MNYKDAISAIKSVLNLSESKQKFFDTKLKDGLTIITVEGDELKPGAKVDIVAEDGTLSPAPDGEHMLETGETIIVESGVIKEVLPKMEEEKKEEPALAEDAKAEETKADEIPTDALEIIHTKIAELEKKMEDLLSKLTEQRQYAEQLSKVVDIIGAVPSDNPIVKTEPVELSKKTETGVDAYFKIIGK